MTAAKTTLRTGIRGLDAILCGGLPTRRMYLVQGAPGAGKTTLSLQFLLQGIEEGEPVLYVTLSESRSELEAVMDSHGWSLDGLDIYEMSTGEDTDALAENTLFLPAEVELTERVRALLEVVDRIRPRRLVVDSCSELRLLAETPLRFRRQLLALKQELVARGCTVLLIETLSPGADVDVMLQSLVHGVLRLEQLSPLYGAERRRLRVHKLREVAFRGGYHDFTLTRGGLVVYPRLVAAEHHPAFEPGSLSSDLPEVDAMLGGGLDRGTSTLFMGPAGSGKSALASQYACAAASRGEHVALFTFDEGIGTLLQRATALGMPLREQVDAGRVQVQQVDPAELSPGEFVQTVRDAVEQRGARMVVIDSLNGYLHAMPEEQFVVLQLHELLSFLRQVGVATVLVMAQHGLTSGMTAPVDVSYLADAVVLFRYFEAGGRVHKALSVLKKRSGAHEDAIREFTMGPGGLHVGPPLENFRGVLTGVPHFVGDPGHAGPLLGTPRDDGR